MTRHTRSLTIFVLLSVLVACTRTSSPSNLAKDSCPLTKVTWIKPPEDSAVLDPPAFGYYFVNKDLSIWASAWQAENEEYPLRAGEEGNKLGWFRPAGADLVITGQRIDAEAPPLEAEIGCCYPTRFQASGLYFSTEGCWKVNARAEDRELSFTV